MEIIKRNRNHEIITTESIDDEKDINITVTFRDDGRPCSIFLEYRSFGNNGLVNSKYQHLIFNRSDNNNGVFWHCSIGDCEQTGSILDFMSRHAALDQVFEILKKDNKEYNDHIYSIDLK